MSRDSFINYVQILHEDSLHYVDYDKAGFSQFLTVKQEKREQRITEAVSLVIHEFDYCLVIQ